MFHSFKSFFSLAKRGPVDEGGPNLPYLRRPDFIRQYPTTLDDIADGVIDAGLTKYVTVKVFRDHTRKQFKFIVRGLRQPQPETDDYNTMDMLIDGADSVLWRKVMKELEPFGVVFKPVGWGKLYHDLTQKFVTFYEENDGLPGKFDGHSEHCFRARQIIECERFGHGYVTYHVLRRGNLSPNSAQRRRDHLRKLNAQLKSF